MNQRDVIAEFKRQYPVGKVTDFYAHKVQFVGFVDRLHKSREITERVAERIEYPYESKLGGGMRPKRAAGRKASAAVSFSGPVEGTLARAAANLYNVLGSAMTKAATPNGIKPDPEEVKWALRAAEEAVNYAHKQQGVASLPVFVVMHERDARAKRQQLLMQAAISAIDEGRRLLPIVQALAI